MKRNNILYSVKPCPNDSGELPCFAATHLFAKDKNSYRVYLCDIENNAFAIRLEADNNEDVLWCIPFAL